jgi:hypothetical protein
VLVATVVALEAGETVRDNRRTGAGRTEVAEPLLVRVVGVQPEERRRCPGNRFLGGQGPILTLDRDGLGHLDCGLVRVVAIQPGRKYQLVKALATDLDLLAIGPFEAASLEESSTFARDLEHPGLEWAVRAGEVSPGRLDEARGDPPPTFLGPDVEPTQRRHPAEFDLHEADGMTVVGHQKDGRVRRLDAVAERAVSELGLEKSIELLWAQRVRGSQ